jgi:electron transfer flavoprotein beta subunit
VRIVVCVKYVPDIQSDRRLGPDGLVVRDGWDGTLNELDENAVEAALVLAEAAGDGEVVALTVGPAGAEDAARRALQMGADRAVQVRDDAIAGSDVFGTVTVLAAAIRRLGAESPVDLVLTGMAGLDGLTSLLPAALAAELDLPQLTLAAELAVEDGAQGAQVRVRRELDAATETLTAPLPALVSVTDQANAPRYPNFKGIMAARKKPLDVLTLADLGVDPATVGAAGARTRILEAAERPQRENRVLITDDGTAGTRLAEFLVENKLVQGA